MKKKEVTLNKEEIFDILKEVFDDFEKSALEKARLKADIVTKTARRRQLNVIRNMANALGHAFKVKFREGDKKNDT